MVVSTKREAGRLEAGRIARSNNRRLPAHVLLDDCLVRSERWKLLHPCFLGAKELLVRPETWAEELLVHPEKGGKFHKGADIVDSKSGWTLPASYVPEEAIGRKRIGLLVDPEELKEEGGRVVVHPAGEPLIIFPLSQKTKDYGNADPRTRIPRARKGFGNRQQRARWGISLFGVEPMLSHIFAQSAGSGSYFDPIRWLHKSSRIEVAPIVRNTAPGFFRRVISTAPPDFRGTIAVGVTESEIKHGSIALILP